MAIDTDKLSPAQQALVEDEFFSMVDDDDAAYDYEGTEVIVVPRLGVESET